MHKLKRTLKNDIWIILLDIIAVNAAYFLGILIRFFVGGKFYHSLRELPYKYAQFAPYYTIICIIVFFAFRLYGGMWRYAGVSDMNRIIGATVVTTIFQVAGTLIFVERMPLTFYFVGAALQFFFVCLIRFSYRLVIIERRKLSNKGVNAIIIGAGENGRYILGMLERGNSIKPVCFADKSYSDMSMDGLPVYSLDEMEEIIDRRNIKCVVIADTELGEEDKKKIQQVVEGFNLTQKDYTPYLTFPDDIDVYEGAGGVVKGPEQGQRSIPFSPPDISDAEVEEVVEALRSGWITTGPRTKLLERRLAAYIETGETDVDTESEPDRWKNRVVCLNSATAAEELNLRILGIHEGDEVIVPAYTYTASASAAIHCGATVKFVDIQKDGDPVTGMPEMDYEKLERAITEKTKAIVVVDLGGVVADYEKVFEIVERKKSLFTPLESDGSPLGDLNSRIQKSIGRVAVVADDAHSLGASRTFRGKKTYCGAIADFTSFSFHAVKNFTTAEGGASTWRLPTAVYENGLTDAEIYKFYQLLSLHGQSKDALAKTKVGAWEYDVIGPWYKCNMTDIMAAIGLRQLDRYKGLLERRVEIIKRYDETCDRLGIKHLIHHTDGMDSSNHLYIIRIPGANTEKRNKIIEEMAKLGVATNVHYKPLPMMTAYKEANIGNYPNTYNYYENLLTLPLHTKLSNEDVDMVCDSLEKVMHEVA